MTQMIAFQFDNKTFTINIEKITTITFTKANELTIVFDNGYSYVNKKDNAKTIYQGLAKALGIK